MGIRDDEIQRLVHYAKGMGVKVTFSNTLSSGMAAAWATDGSEILINNKTNLSKTEVKRSDDHTTKIMVTDNIGLEMRYPKFVEMVEIYQSINSNDILSLVYSCVKCVYTDEEVFDNFTKEELEEFINSFSKSQFELLEKFFLSMPKITQRVEQACPNCGTINSTNLEGLQNFFA